MTGRDAPIGVGILGAGFAAKTQTSAFRITGRAEIRAVAARTTAHAERFAHEHEIPSWGSVQKVIEDPSVEVVVVCTPHLAHEELILHAAAAGKHILCEKPLTASAQTGSGPERAIADLHAVRASCRRVREAIDAADVRFLYGENWVYSPAFQRLSELVGVSRGDILDIRADESHHGSHARATRRRETAGGGALLSLGSHPLGAALQLKMDEGARRGTTIRPITVSAEVARFWDGPDRNRSATALETDWVDVETWGSISLGFDDGTRATVISSFAALGGIRNTLEVYGTSSAYRTRFGALDALEAYAPEDSTFEGAVLQEKLETNAGWSRPSIGSEWLRGYATQAADMIDAVRSHREPRAGLDLGIDVVELIYLAYVSAALGRRIDVREAAA